ncbi:MAG: hypothetical protein C4562_04660 [Actinobacteria bacterium]|nr:MAG: hypothetical protein C4562_04660 [Actinomycetota bacterium]
MFGKNYSSLKANSLKAKSFDQGVDMPREDKAYKPRKPILCKTGKEEKEALRAMAHAPKFPAKLIGLKARKK